MSGTKRDLGIKSEELAAKFLMKKGFQILERNFRCRLGEIDIVARQGSYLVFVEVRSRSSTRYGLPQESINRNKINKLRQLARFYLLGRSADGLNVRFDVVAVNWAGEPQVTHIEDAF